jgi:hypothetical protein
MTIRHFRNLLLALLTALTLIACNGSNNSNNNTGAPPTMPEPEPVPEPEPEPLPTSFTFEGEPCQPPQDSEARTLLIKPDCVDPAFTGAYIDIDEQRTASDASKGITVSYRYVHGGFTDTNARFAFYYPDPDSYQGRFFQSTYPTVGTEGSSDSQIVFAISHGAYVVSSNNGGGVTTAPATGGYRVNAAAAKMSRIVAKLIFAEEAPARGYIYGVSGGALQTLGSAERTEGVYDGTVPIVPGVPNSIPNFQSAQVLALRGLEGKWPAVVDALEPGGSGDPYATLNDDERAILEEVTRLGFPLRGWWQWETMTGGAFELTVLAVKGIDAGYVDDFYSVPGYEGVDDPAVTDLRAQFDTTIATLEDGKITLAGTPTGYLAFADLMINSGESAGETVENVSVAGNQVMLPGNVDQELLAGLAVGDQVRVDNSLWIALQFYPRHQVPSPDQYGWAQYLDAGGVPLYAQRPVLAGEIISGVFGGVPTGDFKGKMIMLSSVLDVEAFAWSGDWYRLQALETHGSSLDSNYRLWFTDNADHVSPRFPAANAHIVDYNGVLEQALLYLDNWVLNGTAPPPTSGYSITEDTQVVLADAAPERGGIQPVITHTVAAGDVCPAQGGDVASNATAGEPVSFRVRAATPPQVGKFVRIEWDFDSDGEYTDAFELDGTLSEIQRCVTHTYATPGTYFAAARVTTQREGNLGSSYGLVKNLARVRVVIE